jgi:hypothetical protein
MVLALLAPALWTSAAWGADGHLEGAVTFRGEGRVGVNVEVYLEKKKQAGGTPFGMTESGAGGRYGLTLPPGEYYLWARESAPAFGPPKVTEYPRNPVTVRSGERTVLPDLGLVEVGRESAEPIPAETGISGRVVIAGGPAADTTVMIYDGKAARLMGPGYAAMIYTGPDGLFEAALAPGKYQVAARKRREGGAAGFLRQGDFSVDYDGNPVTVREGEYTDTGDLVLHEVDRERLVAEEARRAGGGSPTHIAGTVIGPEGKPLPGQYVFVYRDQGMIGRPDKVARSAGDGSFSFDLSAGGRYYLGARSTIGGPRQPGEMAGRLSGSPDSSVEIEKGRRAEGLTIRMEVVW